MIPKALALDLVTPDKLIVHEDVDEVQLPGWEGMLGVLPGHTPLLALLQAGEVTYRKGQERSTLVVESGLAEVLPDRVTVLVDTAEAPEAIDVARQEEIKKEAEQAMKQPQTADEAERARVAMMTAIVKLRAAERVRTRRGV